MSHLQIIINGETVFDEERVGDWQLPPRPDQIPASIRAQLDPQARPAPWMKAMIVAMLGKALRDHALRDPRLVPLDVELTTRATGWTLAVDIPEPKRSDISVVDDRSVGPGL